MGDISRRGFVAGAATAAAVLGLNGPIEFLPSALAQAAGDQQNPSGKPFYRFKVGDMEITQVFDGETPRPLDPSYVKNASIADVKKALQAGGLSGENIPVPYTMTFAKVGGKITMFDAGNAEAGMPATGRHFANMKAAGIDTKDVSQIVLTHFHPDHIFGLYNKDNSPIYPNAQIILPSAELAFWTDASRTAKLPARLQGLAKRIAATLGKWKNVSRFEGDKDIAPGIRAVATHGHTPGHTSYHLSSGGGQIIVLGDVTNVRQLFVTNPGWHVMFDMNAQAAEATRRKTFDRVVADNLIVTGYHWGMPGAGTLSKDGKGYVFKPHA